MQPPSSADPPVGPRYSERVVRVIALAREESGMFRQSQIDTEHLLLGLIDEGHGIGAQALASLGVSHDGVRSRVEATVGIGRQVPTWASPLTAAGREVLELSGREALAGGHTRTDTEHVLLALLRQDAGAAAQILISLGVDYARARDRVTQLRVGGHRGALPDLSDYDSQIERVRLDIASALRTEDFGTFNTLTAGEDRLVKEKRRVAKEWLAGLDDLAAVEMIETIRGLRGQVEHLKDLLRDHGVEPDSGPRPAPADG
jgi:ATP-dependent Clp protease ATP-binding subunit ClpA